MLTKTRSIMGVTFLGIFIIVSFVNLGADTKVTKEQFEKGLEIIGENGYVLIGYYKPAGSDQEIAEKITSYEAMIELAKKEITTRFVLYNPKTEDRIEVTKIEGNEMQTKSTGENIWKQVCSALGVYNQCKQFFKW